MAVQPEWYSGQRASGFLEEVMHELGSGMQIGVPQRLIREEGQSQILRPTAGRNAMSLLLPALFLSPFFFFSLCDFLFSENDLLIDFNFFFPIDF